MSRFNSIAVRQQVGHEVATQQAGDFTAERAVVDGHLRVTVEVAAGRSAVDVRVHALWILVVLRAVAVFHAEFVSIAAKPRALELRDQETRADPGAVMAVTVDGCHPPEVHVSNIEGVATVHR